MLDTPTPNTEKIIPEGQMPQVGQDPQEEKLQQVVDKKIPLMELFGPTIQGEGTVIGQQTYFLRFGLCDYRCTMCDSLHAVIPALVKANAKYLTQQEIFEAFWEFRHPNSTNWLTFSGGNPAIHDLSYLVGLCKVNDIKINVETQGTFYRGWLNKVDSLTISPKGPGMGEKHVHATFQGFMNKVYENGLWPIAETIPFMEVWHGPNLCLKIVVFDQRDLDFAKEIFLEYKDHPLFKGKDISNHFYLSLGNMNPPKPDGGSAEFDMDKQLDSYRALHEDICKDEMLSKVRLLPQWHAFVWGNLKGK